jgi:hypothetical protein
MKPVAIVSRYDAPTSRVRKIAQTVMGLFAETRICPRCASDPVQAILSPRKTYMGKCPKCGGLWT